LKQSSGHKNNFFEPNFGALKARFASGFRWSFSGSIFFEASHLLHNFALFSFLGTSAYGLIGSLFSIIYLVIHITDLGFETSFAPFIGVATQNKKSFRRLFPLYVLPQIIFLSLGFLFVYFLFPVFFNQSSQLPSPILFFSLVICEGLRIFFRRFLHNIFFSRVTVIVELILAIAYYAAVWIPHLVFGHPLTAKLIFTPFLFNSLFATFIFIATILRFYRTLPCNNLGFSSGLFVRIFRARYFNYFIGIEAFLISGNFLVPFFAISFGLAQAGLFKIASVISHSIRALIKSAIHFPGNALLATIKTQPLKTKLRAFYSLSTKLNQIIFFIFTFLLINHSLIHSSSSKAAWFYALIFVGITLVHQLFVVYEQFYVIEEFASKLFMIKSIEFILFYILIFANKLLTPATTLIYIAIIQFFSFALLAFHAYRRWKIKPHFTVGRSFAAFTIAISLFFYLITKNLPRLLG